MANQLSTTVLTISLQEGAPKNPRDAATAIVNALPQSPAIEGKPTLAGPGFINVKLSSAWLSDRIQAMIKQVWLLG